MIFYWFVYFLHVLRTPNVWTGYPPAVRPVYPYSGDSSGPGAGQPNSAQPPASPAQDPYNRYNTNPAAGYSPRPPYGTAQGAGVPPASQASGPGPYPGHPDYYNRPDQVIMFIRKLAPLEILYIFNFEYAYYVISVVMTLTKLRLQTLTNIKQLQKF